MTLARAHVEVTVGHPVDDVLPVLERDDVVGVAVPPVQRDGDVGQGEAPGPTEQHDVVDRSPQAWSVANGVATVSGDSAGTTGGMSAKFAQQKYGKWETRMRTNARDPEYHPVLILWPNNNTSPNCAEIDYAEGSTNTAQIKFFLHYACGGSNFQTTAAKTIDTTQWHNYAVEWTPAGITGYIDGVKTFSDTNPAHLPSVGMHQTLQLDWFPDGSATKPSQMQVDWVRVYK